MGILEQRIHTIFAQGQSRERGHLQEQLMARSGQIVVAWVVGNNLKTPSIDQSYQTI